MNGLPLQACIQHMKKLFYIAAVCALIAAPAAGAAGKSIQVRMKDPGCHWFYVHGKYATKYVSNGPITIKNFDEAALKFVGPGGTKIERVGKSITLSHRGIYRITMVGQAPDDNHLKLTIK
jgi:nitrous oxidase accessory protein NosD